MLLLFLISPSWPPSKRWPLVSRERVRGERESCVTNKTVTLYLTEKEMNTKELRGSSTYIIYTSRKVFSFFFNQKLRTPPFFLSPLSAGAAAAPPEAEPLVFTAVSLMLFCVSNYFLFYNETLICYHSFIF